MFFAKKVSVYAIVSYFCAISLGVAADTTVTSKQYVDNQLLKKINLETGAGISAGDMLRATVDTNDANKMKWLAWTPDYVTSSMLNDYLTTTVAANTYQTKITSDSKLLSDLVDDTNQTHKFVTASEKSTWNAKQNAISDLATIRSGASAGATAVQPGDLADVATSGSYNDLTDKPTIPTDTNTTYTFAEGTTNGAFSVTPSGGSAQSVPVHGWADKEDVINKKNDIDAVWVAGLTSAQKAAYYPTVGAVHERLKNYALVNDLASKVDKVVAADKKRLISRDKNGLAVAAISDDVDVADDGSFIVKHAVTADSATTAGSVPWTGVTGAPAIPTDTNTTYTFAEGTTNGAFSVTPSGGSAQSVPVHGWANKQDKITSISTSGTGSVVTAVTASNGTITATKGNVSYNDLTDTPTIPSAPGDIGAQPAGNYVTRSGTTAVGSATQPVYVDANGVATATTYTLGKSVPSNAVFTDSVTTVTKSDGTAGASTAADGSIKVTKDGTTTYPVVQGWANKQDKITSISTSGTGSVVTAVTASNGTITATKGNVSYNDLTDTPTIPSAPGDIGAQPAGNYVTVAQGDTNANKAVITNASGNVTTGTIATDMIAANAVTSAKISDGTIVNADISSSAAIAQSKISGLTTDLASKMTTPTATATGDLLKATVSNGTTTWSAFTPSYASSSHNHPTSDVNLLTGYSKPNSTSALATTDTLNAALGKLETALDGKAASSHTHTSNQVTALTSYSKGTSAAALATTDTLNAALGKLENKADNAATTASGKWTKPSGSNKQMLQHNGTDWVAVTPDTTPTQNSTKPVESGGVYTALAGKAASNHDHDGTYVKKTESGAANQNKLMVRNGSGTEISGTSSDISLATANGVTTVTVTHATSADTATSAGTANSVAWANVTGKPTADETTLGIGKLYTSVGTETDGSMTQNAITDELNSKLSKNSADVQFVSDHEVDALAGLLTQGTDVNGNLKSLGMQIATNTSNITGLSGNKVNGALLSNANSVFYGTSSTAAGTAQKEVSISSITTLDTGTVIVVKPTLTSTAANGTIKLNDFAAKAMRYNNAAITTANAGLVWKANTASTWVYDGTYWQYVGPVYTASTGVSISNGAISNSGVRSVTASSSGSNGSLAVNTNGTTTYPVVKGWDTKVDVGQGASKANMVLYTDSSGNVTPDSVKVPITDSNATGGWSYMWID